MATVSHTDFERESRELVEEFLQRDLLSPEATRRVEGLYAENRTTEALEVILAERRGQTPDAGFDRQRAEDPRLL